MRKSIALFVYMLLLHPLYAQTETPSAAYMRSLNSYVHGAPESSQMMKYIDYPVNLSTGTPNISLPIYTLSGKGIDLSLALSYHAGGGIKVSEMASNAGQGWLLSSGGEVSREIRGLADERSSIGYMYKSKPVAYYDSIKPRYAEDPVGMAHLNEWIDVAEGRMDLEPDVFYFSFGGYSGKFLYDDRLSAFVNMNTSDSRLKFQFNSNVFTIVADNGNRYVFAAREQSRTVTIPLHSPGTQTSPSELQTTSWKLSKIINADATDSIMINYDYYSAAYYTLGSSTAYTVVQGNGNRSPALNTYNKNMVEGYTKLKSIVSRTDSVSFQYATTEREDYPGDYALSKVLICARGGGIKNIFRLHTSYFLRNEIVGDDDDRAETAKSLRLDALTEYGNSESNANPPRYSFTYNSTPMQNRFSFAQDMWGYANDNTYGGHLAPRTYYPLGTSPTLLPGADRSPDEAKMKAGILERIDLPTGGFTTFEYEANTVSNPSENSTPNSISVGYGISVWKAPGQTFENIYIDSFIVDEEPDAAINGNNEGGGVFANISLSPVRDDALLSGGALYQSLPVYRLDRAANPPQPVWQTPFSGFIAQGPAYTSGYYLPNGKYYIRAQQIDANNLNHPDKMSLIRSLTFAVNFNISDTAAASKKYMAGGLRIKRITAKDNYTSNIKVREFDYGGADTTWGRLIGPKYTAYYETKPDHSQYFVRPGSIDIPGQGSLGSNVVYSQVVETMKEGNKSYNTYHYFLNLEPRYPDVFPFVPAVDNEYARGKEIRTQWTQLHPLGSIVTLKQTKNAYEFSPGMSLDPAMSIRAIKTTIDGYVSNPGGSFPWITISPYYNIRSYIYLLSDSTISYEYTNGIAQKTWNEYTYGPNNNLPLTITSKDSKGSILVQKNGYALDQAEPGMAPEPALAAQLDASNRVGEVLATRTYKDGVLLNQMFKKGHFSGSQFLMDSVLYAEYDNALESDGKVLDYDSYGNPLTIEGKGSRFRKYHWRKERNLALATCSMAKKGNFVFTSFEYPNEYSSIPEDYRSNSGAFSGNYSYVLNGSLIFGGFNPGSNIEAYAWLSQGSFSVNGITAVSTGRTKDNWILYRVEVPYNTTVTVAGNCIMDQLVIAPAGSVLEANVFDALDRITAKVGGNMQTTFFDYDAFGRLQYIRDEKGNILKSNTYEYQVTQ